MTRVTINDAHLTNIAAAIREKNGTTNTYKPGEMAGAIQAISASEDLSEELTEQANLLDEQSSKLVVAINSLKNKVGNIDTSAVEDAFITHTFGGDYTNDRVTSVKYGTFYGDTALTSVSFPNVTSAADYSFYKCSNLKSINIPKLTSASTYAFAYTAPSILYFPELTSASTYTFAYITNRCEVNMPKLITIGNSTFRDSKGIFKADFTAATKIDTLAFYYCNNLETLILRNPDAVCSLTNTSVFTGSKIAGGTGYIYVPDALVEDYKAATNWSSFANQIKPLSELEVVTNE